MSDVFDGGNEPDADDLYDPEDDELNEGADEVAASGSGSSFGRSYDELPEGYVTAGGFAKVLKERRDAEVRPQVIYAQAKTNKTFPAIRHTDNRIIVPIEAGLAWFDAKEARKSDTTSRSNEPTAFEKAQAAAAEGGSTEE